MPRYDRTGPMGKGPKTGRGLGVNMVQNQVANENEVPFNANRQRRNLADGSGARNGGRGQAAGFANDQAGRGMGRGMGRRMGRGLGRGTR